MRSRASPRYRVWMSAQILEAIELAVPGVTDSIKYQPPSWIAPLERETDVWLGGIDISLVEVTPEWNQDDLGVGRLIVNVFTTEGVVAQATITVERENGQGTFHGWKIVRLKTITSLAWQEHSIGSRKVPQVTATFQHLSDPVLIPGEIDHNIAPEKVTEIFRILRDSWIDTGISESAAAQG